MKKNTSRLFIPTLLSVALIIGSILPFGFSEVISNGEEINVVRVGYYENEVFEEGAREGAVKTGYAYEYYRKLSEYTGWEYEYVYGDFADLYDMLLDGRIDLLAGLAKKDDRLDIIGYPDEPMGNETYSLVKHDSDPDVTNDPKTLNGKKIGVLDSAMVAVLNGYLSENSVNAEVVPYPDYEKLFTSFDNGEVDILAAEGDGARERDHAEIVGIFGTSDYYLCVSIKRQDVLKELNEAQAQLLTEEPDYISSLRNKYYSSSVSSRNFSGAEKKWLSENDSITIGYLDDYLPYSDKASDGSADGLVKELVPKLFAQMGITDLEIDFVGYAAYDDMIADLYNGSLDAAFPVGGGLYYSEENGIYQSDTIISATMELVFEGEYSEEKTKRFAVNQNNRMQYYYVRTQFPDAEIIEYPSIEDCMEAVKADKAGCTILNGLRAIDILKNSRYRQLSVKQLGQRDARCFGVRIGNEGLLKLLNHGKKIVGEDYILNLAYKYNDGLYTYTFGDMVKDHMEIFIVLILLVAGIIILVLYRGSKIAKKEMLEKEEARKNLEESRGALAEALDAAENANRAKTIFLNNMSHDIRTPMNAIVGFTALATSHIDNKELVKNYLGKIDVSSHHLLSLINDVLDMSRIESGTVKIEESPVHLPDLIEDIKSIIQASVSAKHQELKVETHIENEDIITDRLRLNQILLNILSNAVKFTDNGGKISFTVKEKPCKIEEYACLKFDIEDNGIGMSDEFINSIFEPFTREQSSTVSGIQGTGLGMAITKNIVDMMGGKIDVKSKEGKGSRFIVRLQCRICDQAENEEAADNKPVHIDFTGRRVLLAEDSEINQEIATTILEEAGFEVEVASDGTDAVRMVEEADAGYYDIVMMDVQMPVMDGYEATRQIRAMSDEAKSGIPIVAVTANVFEEDRQNAARAGMNAHLAKPYDVPDMMRTISEVIAKSEGIVENSEGN